MATLIPDSCLPEVAVLSNLAKVFGLLDSVKKALERRKQLTDSSQQQIFSTLSSELTTKTHQYILENCSIVILLLCKNTEEETGSSLLLNDGSSLLLDDGSSLSLNDGSIG